MMDYDKNAEYTKALAKVYAKQALHFDDVGDSRIAAFIDELPLSQVGMAYCPACESVLCGVCGDCHSWDLQISDPECPNDHDTTGRDCVFWWQALKAIVTVQRAEAI